MKKGETISESQRQKIIKTKKNRVDSGYYNKIRKCIYCGGKLHFSQRRFCCNKHRGFYFTGENHPGYKNGLSIATKFCIKCKTSISAEGKTGLCRPCHEKQRQGRNNPNWQGGISTVHCLICNKIISVKNKRCRTCFDTTKQRSIIQSKKWRDAQYAKNQSFLIQKGLGTSFNKPERKLCKLLCRLFPDEYKYVGDGKVWINGKNPDFININGQKKIIEVFGDYWHSKKVTGLKKKIHRIQRQNYFADYGYKTLVIWEKELQRGNRKRLKIKLRIFHEA